MKYVFMARLSGVAKLVKSFDVTGLVGPKVLTTFATVVVDSAKD